jgi:hypothetical protein
MLSGSVTFLTKLIIFCFILPSVQEGRGSSDVLADTFVIPKVLPKRLFEKLCVNIIIANIDIEIIANALV